MSRRIAFVAHLGLVASILAAGFAVAQPCEHYGDRAHWVTSQSCGNAWEVAVVGDLVYVAGGAAGLFVFDATDPALPEQRGHVDTPWIARGVAVSGNYAYVADDDGGFQIVDVANIDALTLRGRIATFQDACDVAVNGSVVYVAASGYGIVVIDVADPDNPVRVRTIDTPGYTYGVLVAGGRLYAADSWNGLLVYDLTDPTTPAFLGGFDTPGSANAVVVRGNHAAVADVGEGVAILDVTDPASISLVASIPTRFNALDITCSPDGLLVVTEGGAGVELLDGLDMTHVVNLGAMPSGDDAYGVAIAGDWAYVANDDAGLAVYDVAPALAASSLATRLPMPGYCVDIAAENGFAFMGSQDSGLQVFDLANPAAPAHLTTLPLSGYPCEVIVRNNLAYVTCWSGGLQIVDVSTPAAPTVMGDLDTPGYAVGLALFGDVAYVADDDSLRAIDVMDPATPVAMKSTYVSGEATWVGANHLGAFVGTYGGELHWYADTPGGFELVDDTPLFGHSSGVAVQDSLVFALTGSSYYGELLVLLASPTTRTLEQIAAVSLPRFAEGLTLDRGLAYIADGMGGVQIVDVHDPFHPVLLGGTIWDLNDAKGVCVAGEYAYVANNTWGLVTVPRECTEYVGVFLGWFDAVPALGVVDLAWQAFVEGEPGAFRLTAHLDGATWEVACHAAGSDVWTARDAAPRLAGGGTAHYTLWYRDGAAGWIEVGSRSVALAPPARAHLLAAYPNPFNPRTTIPFILDRPGEATLMIHDQAGRRVAVVATGWHAAGAHAAIWDGRDDRGRALPAGVYVARLQTDSYVDARKLTLVK